MQKVEILSVKEDTQTDHEAICRAKVWWFTADLAQVAANRMRSRHGDGCHCLVYVCRMGAVTRGENHLHIGHLKGDPCRGRQKEK